MPEHEFCHDAAGGPDIWGERRRIRSVFVVDNGGEARRGKGGQGEGKNQVSGLPILVV